MICVIDFDGTFFKNDFFLEILYKTKSIKAIVMIVKILFKIPLESSFEFIFKNKKNIIMKVVL